jgi:hypothetical protein
MVLDFYIVFARYMRPTVGHPVKYHFEEMALHENS